MEIFHNDKILAISPPALIGKNCVVYMQYYYNNIIMNLHTVSSALLRVQASVGGVRTDDPDSQPPGPPDNQNDSVCVNVL